MHKEQIEYCKRIKNRFPEKFHDIMVLDVGSLDINGNNRYLFESFTHEVKGVKFEVSANCDYFGIDIVKGKNVDFISHMHKYETVLELNTIISTEMLEHDKYIYLSLRAMINLLKPGGLLLITAATTGRKEHGTTRHGANQSPGTNDYYKNVDLKEFTENIKPDEWREFGIEINNKSKDIYFFGIKK